MALIIYDKKIVIKLKKLRIEKLKYIKEGKQKKKRLINPVFVQDLLI